MIFNSRGTICWLLLAFYWVLSSGCAQQPHVPTQPATATIKFLADWWTIEQMENLNLDDPPKKTERIELQQWDPSDPVSTPHPDTVFIAVEFTNLPVQTSITVSAAQRWLIGSIEEKAKAQWTDLQPFSDPQRIEFSNKSYPNVTIGQLQLKDKLFSLFNDNQWAYAVEVTVIAEQPSANTTIIKDTRRLDLKLAD